MRKVLAVIAAVFSIGTLFFPAMSSAKEECKTTTQGIYALALAQVLQFDVSTVEAAISRLTAIGVKPDDGWKPEECLTDAVAAQIRASLDRAIAQGAIPPGVGVGAADGLDSKLKKDKRNPVSPFKP